MSYLLNSGMTGSADSFKDLKKLREEAVSKWDELGFLNNVDGLTKKNIAMFLESDAVQFMPGYEETNRWCVYILRCGDGTLYTGITNNIVKRLKTHRSGKGAKYTRGRLPLILEAYKVVGSKSEALKLEYKVKKQPKHKKLEFLKSWSTE
jgi:putative endonuclease